ncbi:MAG: 2-phosphosulfolactate phosphatase [Phycisphaerae bacterium]
MIDVVLLPAMLNEMLMPQSQVVVFDVLRASSTIVTALHNGAREVRLFSDVDAVLHARGHVPPPVLSAGERGCVMVPGFDLGNSPAEYQTHRVGGASVLLSTTNGTRAVVAAQAAADIFIGSLLNAQATAEALNGQLDHLHTLMVLAGTDGQISQEDVIGAGAVLWHLLGGTYRIDLPYTDTAWMAYHCFASVRERLGAALRLGAGGINIIESGLEDDIDLCSQLNSMPLAVRVQKNPLRALAVPKAR